MIPPLKPFAARCAVLVLILFVSLPSIAQKYAVHVMAAGTTLWGYANEHGTLFIPAIYSRSWDFSPSGWAVVQNANLEYFFIGINGRRFGPPIAIDKVHGGFSYGVIAVNVGSSWGYLNEAGQIAIKPQYGFVNEFHDGYAVVSKNKKFFVINPMGEETPVEASQIKTARRFSEGLAPFYDGKSLGYLDIHGKVAIKPIYDGVGYFVHGIAWARGDNDLIGVLNKKGEWVFKPQFDIAVNAHANSRWLRVKGHDGWEYVDSTAAVLKFKDTEAWGDFGNGLAPGMKDGRWGFFNDKGEWVIPPTFGGVRDFQNGFAAVRKNGKWGMIDPAGNWVIQPVWGGIKDMVKID